MPSAPVIRRPLSGQLSVKLPDNSSTSWFVRNHLRNRVSLARTAAGYTVKRKDLRVLIDQLSGFYGGCQVVFEYRRQVRCTASCQNALREECVCSCAGRGHAAGMSGAVLAAVKETSLELEEDLQEVTRTYARPSWWRGPDYFREHIVRRALGLSLVAS